MYKENNVSMKALESDRPSRKRLYFLGGIACLAIALMYLTAAAVYAPAMRQAPAPATVLDWFELLQTNRLVGLFYLGLADVPIVILFGLVSLALHSALKDVDDVWAMIAVPFALVGMAVYLATNVSFSMLSLSGEYATAGSEAHQSMALAAGQALLSITRGTGTVGLPLVWLAGLIFSILMLRGRILSKPTAWIGIIAFALLVPSFLFSGYTYGASSQIGESLALVTNIGGGLLSLVWYILTGIGLIRLNRV